MNPHNKHLVDGKYTFRDLVDIDRLRKMLERFSQATGFTTGLVSYPDQELLISTGWRDICTKFHRAHPASEVYCKQSNLLLSSHLKEHRELNVCHCESGLVDGATPIIIKGVYVAYLATGQILFNEPDIEFFRKQGEKYGYDIDAYLQALDEVPVVTEDELKKAMSFLSEMAVMLAEQGLTNLKNREMAQAARDTEEQYRAVFNAAADSLLIFDSDKGTIAEANPAALKMYGYSYDEFIGLHGTAFVHPDYHYLFDQFAETTKDGGVFHAISVDVQKDGSLIDVEVRGTSIAHHGTQHLLAVVHDITERKQAEDALRKGEERLELALSGGGLGTWDWNVETNEVIFNERWAEMLGYSLDEIEPHVRSWEKLVHPDDMPAVMAALTPHLEGTIGHYETEHRVRHKSGEWIWVLDKGQVIERDEEGKPIRACGTHLDITDRKQMEDALRESEGKFARAFRRAPLFMIISTLEDGIFLEVNEMFTASTGYDREEAIGKTSVELGLFSQEVRDALKQEFLDHGHLRGLEMPIRTKAGKTIFASLHGDLITIAGEQRLLIIGEDITTRKQVENALRESEEKHRNVIENIGDGIVMTAVDENNVFRYAFANPAAEKIFGVEPGELVGRQTDEFTAPEQLEESDQRSAKRRRGEAETYDFDIIRPDGEHRSLLINAKPRYDENGEFCGSFSIFTDITERKLAEIALLKEKQFVSTLVQATPVFIVAIDTEGKVIMMNNSMLDTLGYSLDEIVGRDYLTSFVPERDRELLAEVFLKLVDANIPTKNENYMLAKDGHEILVEWHGRAILNERNEFEYFFGVGIDLTERKLAEDERLNLERQVLQAQKMESLGILAGGIAHDFNNLLMAVLGNADLALQDLSPTAPACECITEVVTAAKRAAGLAKQMLAYSGKGKFEIQLIGINEFVEEMSHLLEVSISKKVVLKYNYADNLPGFDGDATQIRQIIMNLIVNASEAVGGESGIISISTGAMDCSREYLDTTTSAIQIAGEEPLPEGLYVYFEVTDTGCGMDKETLVKIFDPFFSTKFTGRGLGLAATLGIIRGHQGVIKVYSEVGRGTMFKVLFPASDDVAEARQAGYEHEAEAWRGSGTILLADDDESVIAVGKRMLKRLGFTVLTAADGMEAVQLFREHSGEIICVLLD